VRAYVEGSTITAGGDVEITATADETIKSYVFAGSVAIAAGGVGVGVGGSGVVAINTMAADVNAHISESSHVTGKSVILTADDTSSIMAFGGAAAITGGFGGTGVAVSIGVSLAFNTIANNVAAFISGSTVESKGGKVGVQAIEHSQINAVSAAAALAVGIGGVGVAVSGAGAQASNTVLTATNAYIENSTVVSTSDVDVIAQSLPASGLLGTLNVGDKAAADAFGLKLDDAGSTDADDEESTPAPGANERDDDIDADNTFLAGELSTVLTNHLIVNSGHLAVTIRTEGSEWSVVDRVNGNSWVLRRDGNLFKVSAPTISAAVIAATAVIGGGSVGVGVSIGVSFATNLIGFKLGVAELYDYDYTTGDALGKQLVHGDRVKIEDGVREGYVYEYIGQTTEISDYTTDDGYKSLNEDDLVMVSDGYDNTKGEASAIYRYVGSSDNVNLGSQDYNNTALWESVGSGKLSMQDYGNTDLWQQVNLEEAPVEVQAYVVNSSIDAVGALNQTAVSDQSIDALVVAGSAAASGGGVGVSVSGADAIAINTVTTDVKAFIEGDGASGISAGSIAIKAEDTSSISAITGAASLAAGFGGVGVAVSIGISLAFNEISNEVAAYHRPRPAILRSRRSRRRRSIP